MTEFPILKISPAAFRGAKKIRGGAAEKYRVSLPDLGSVILKLDEESLNGAWVEKITHELAKLNASDSSFNQTRCGESLDGADSSNR